MFKQHLPASFVIIHAQYLFCHGTAAIFGHFTVALYSRTLMADTKCQIKADTVVTFTPHSEQPENAGWEHSNPDMLLFQTHTRAHTLHLHAESLTHAHTLTHNQHFHVGVITS